MTHYLDFEKSVAELELKLKDLREMDSDGGQVTIEDELKALSKKADQALAKLYSDLTPWQKTQVARHQDRPHFNHFVKGMFTEFTPLAGDRQFGDDEAITGGLARFDGTPVCVIGHEKGSDTQSRLRHNFGMARPEGYRKAVRLMETANKFGLPVITLVDTAGAFPGVDAEERGQAEAIARSIDACLDLTSPNISVIAGEGGSGGAIALATSNKVLMLEHAIYSVASPEAAASILWRDSGKKENAATMMKVTAQDLLGFGIVDAIIPEPVGGAHRDPDLAISNTTNAIREALRDLSNQEPSALKEGRSQKFLAMTRI